MIKKVGGCKYNPKKSPIAKIVEHVLCGYLMSMIWTFDGIENKHDVYRVKDCTKTFCEPLRKHTMKTINFEKKKTIPLTSKEYDSCLTQANCQICQKRFADTHIDVKIIVKLETITIIQENMIIT